MPENIPYHLIVRYLANEASIEEQEQLLDWVNQDKKHQRLFNECVELWSTQRESAQDFSVALGLKKLNSRIDEIEDAESVQSSWRSSWAIAATLALFILSGFAIFFLGKHTESADIKYTLRKATTVKETFALSDASVITLNTNASLKYPENFNGKTREVYLTGEAYFEIKRDTLKPFIVHTGDISTEVLGTSFIVNAQGDQVSVTVVTGSVGVSKSNQHEILKPSDKITVGTKTNLFHKELADLDRELAWKDGTIIFDETPLSEAAEKIEEHYNVTIEFTNELLKKCTITGKFRNESLEHVLHAIEFSIGVHFITTGNKIVAQGKGCE